MLTNRKWVGPQRILGTTEIAPIKSKWAKMLYLGYKGSFSLEMNDFKWILKFF